MDRDDIIGRVDLAGLLDKLSPSPAGQPGLKGRWRCVDPGHADDHPSLSMFRDHRGSERWRCWSGGHGGTALDAVMLARGVGVREAFEWLADYANMPQPIHISRRAPSTNRASGEPPDVCVVDYVDHCARWLWSPRGRPVRDWLHDRGLEDEVLRSNRVGADPGPQSLRRPRGLPSGGAAATFPALGYSGAVTYVQARYLSPPPHRSKYDNPSAVLASNPRTSWSHALTAPLRDAPLIVCEGIPDALIAAQTGCLAVAVLGASYPDDRVADAIVAGAAGRPIVVCFDSDTAGRSATHRLVELFHVRGVQADVVSPPDGMDVSDWWMHDPATVSRSLRCRVLPAPSVAGVTIALPSTGRSQMRVTRH